MNYKNININELGLKQRISYRASRVALFVPRLLAKLSTKLVVNPIVKASTGLTHEQVKEAAIDLTMQVQEDQAVEMQTKIDEGTANIEEWQKDSYYYETEKAKFKSYKSFVNDLVKKQTKLRQSPKRLLVAKNYLFVMRAFKEKHKEQKEARKMVEQVVAEYQMRKAAIESKKAEIEALEQALAKSRGELGNMQQEYSKFEAENAEIVEQISSEEEYVDAEVEPVEETLVSGEQEEPVETKKVVSMPIFELGTPEIGTEEQTSENTHEPVEEESVVTPVSSESQALLEQMAAMASQTFPNPNYSSFEAYGLEEPGKQKTM